MRVGQPVTQHGGATSPPPTIGKPCASSSSARVDAKFGTKGHRGALASSGGFKTSIWSYKTCAEFAAVAISYDKHGSGPWKLSAKSGVFV